MNAGFDLPSTTANNLDEPVLVLVAVRPTDDSDASCRRGGCDATRAHPPECGDTIEAAGTVDE